MAGSRTLKLSILADIDNLKKNLDNGSQEVQGFGDKLGDFGKKAGLAFAAAGAAAVAYAGKLAVDGVKAAIEDEAAQLALAKTLENVTGATKDQIKATESYITKTSLATGVTDDELRPSLARLVRATNDVEKAQKLQALALDISAGSGKDLQAVTEALSKAQEGNTGALSRLGVGIDKATLKTLSFDEITAKLGDTFENQASAKANTWQGKIDRLNVAFSEGKETIGKYILDAITPLVETVVNKVIPAIQDFTDNLGEKLQPIIKIVKPIVDGLRSAFDSVRDSLQENNDKLQPLYTLFKNIAAFVRDVLAPVLGSVLGKALELIGKSFSNFIDNLADVVDFFAKLYNKIKAVIDLANSFRKSIGNLFSGASYEVPATPSAQSMVTGGDVNITVNGAIDPEGTARAISDLLNNSQARGTLGASGLVY